MDLNLKNKTAIITGKGIGKSTALVLAGEGANVVINDIDPENADSAAREMAQEAAPYGINVNCIAPGHTAVERVKEGGGVPGSKDSDGSDWDEIAKRFFPKVLFRRWREPKKIANTIVFLCSDAASFITGATLDVNGGIIMV